jgi:hypothetical protein
MVGCCVIVQVEGVDPKKIIDFISLDRRLVRHGLRLLDQDHRARIVLGVHQLFRTFQELAYDRTDFGTGGRLGLGGEGGRGADGRHHGGRSQQARRQSSARQSRFHEILTWLKRERARDPSLGASSLSLQL